MNLDNLPLLDGLPGHGFGDEGKQRIRKINRMRRQYYDFYSETLWGQPESYDLMISSSKYGIDGCVETILQSVSSWEAMKSHE